MTAAYFEDHPTDPDKMIMRKPMHPEIKKMYEDYFDKCFAESASKRTWVGLTDAEMKQTCYEACSYDPYAIARAIEAKLKEKNT